MKQYLAALNNRRVWTVLFLGFSSGLPLALTVGTLQAWLTVTGVNIITIGLFGLVGLPYIYKFLWAPLLDRYIPPFLGRRRGWILICQFGLAASIATMALVKPHINPLLMAGLALLTAFLSASQDVVVNAYCTDMLLPEERGLGAGMMVIGYRVALVVSGALAFVIASVIGWHETYCIMALLMLLNTVVTWLGPEIKEVPVPVSLVAAVVEPLKEFLSRSKAIYFLWFIILYKLGEAFTLSLSSTFLLRGMHFSLITVGTVNKFGALIASIVGSALGGLLILRLKLFRSLLIFGLLQALSGLLYFWLALIGKKYGLMVVAIVAENFCGGLATAAFVAFIMTLCDHRYTATQFAILTALSAIGRVFVGPAAGIMVKTLGWAPFYGWSVVIALPGLFLLIYLKKSIDAIS